jgi:hypothetical protein
LLGEQPSDYRALVDRFGFRSVEQAGNALITAKRRLRRSIESIIAEYTDDPDEMEMELVDLARILTLAGPLWLNPEVQLETDPCETDDSIRLADSTPTRLASVLAQARLDSVWLNSEFETIWRETLNGPLVALVSTSERASFEDLMIKSGIDVFCTLNEYLGGTKPSTEVCRYLKTSLRRSSMDQDSGLPGQITSTLYLLMIVLALKKCRVRITQSSNEILLSGTEIALTQTWLDENTRRLLASARDELQPTQGSVRPVDGAP